MSTAQHHSNLNQLNIIIFFTYFEEKINSDKVNNINIDIDIYYNMFCVKYEFVQS